MSSLSEPDLLKTHAQLPLLSRVVTAGQAYGISAIFNSMVCVKGWSHYFYPPEKRPDEVKKYSVRNGLPIRIFLPSGYAKDEAGKLPTLFTIHGGGFVVGVPEDDDKWNREFADRHNVLVIGLNYSKAPYYPFPAGIKDLEALILAILKDESLPINKSNCAIAGFSAGGNLALCLCQSEAIQTAFTTSDGKNGLKAVIPIYAVLDHTIPKPFKATQRPYKSDLSPNRNSKSDMILSAAKFFDWSYIPVGHDLNDPLMSPVFTAREKLPPYVFLVSCELDLLAHDAWRMACRLAGKTEPRLDVKVGREECGKHGELVLEGDERFAWEEKEKGIRWLLIPDVVHGFDHMPPGFIGNEESVKDAALKSEKLIGLVGEWLKKSVWTD